MPYEKLKSENYANFGGINTKVSRYITDKNEFLSLENVDSKFMGCLSSTEGSTLWATSVGNSYGIATTTILGIAVAVTGTTFGGSTSSIVGINRTGVFNINDGTFNNRVLTFPYAGEAQFSAFDTLSLDRLYGSNVYDFFTYQAGGSTGRLYSLPRPYMDGFTYTTFGTGGLSGALSLYFAFVRTEDGLYGPVSSVDITASGVSGIAFRIPDIYPVPQGPTTGSFGVTGIALFYSLNGSTPKEYGPVGFTRFLTPGLTFFINDSFVGFGDTELFDDYFGTFQYGFTTENGSTIGDSAVGVVNPRCIELYNNQLFAGGFFYEPSQVWYSRIGELEKHDNEGFFEVGKDDGDTVTDLVNYFTQLVIFKRNSTWALSGSDPDTFVLVQVSTQYGCLSNRSACVFQQRLWFLDKEGICEYNGANTRIISTQVEPIFRRMNILTATSQAVMIHVKQLNQVWCAIPIDGSNTNNIVVIYDYVAESWTTKKINLKTSPSQDYLTAVSNFNIGIASPTVFYGTLLGDVHFGSPSLFTDNAGAYTCLIKSRYLADLGHSVEKMFRRLYIDADIPAGSTQNVAVNFYTNQSSTAAYSTTMSLSDFQKRIDFGLPAKDLSVELIYNGGQFLKINGFTIEYRFQRAT